MLNSTIMINRILSETQHQYYISAIENLFRKLESLVTKSITSK